jgi:peptidyl-prolyl cis-trans isomerase SurA
VQRTLKLTIFATLLAVILLSLAACSKSGSSDSKDETVAATVNGRNIMLAEVERIVSAQSGGKQDQVSQLLMAQMRLEALDGLIQKEVLLQRAEKEKLLPTEDEVSQYVTAQKTQGGMTEEEFQKRLKAQGLTAESFREEARKLLAIQKLQTKYTGNVNISDREVEDYYNANRVQFVTGRGLDLGEIMVDPRDNGLQDDAKNEADAKVKIDALYTQLKSIGTERFGELAVARSEDGNTQGGDIGFKTQDELKRAGMPETLITQLFGLQPGDYTQPVQFFNGGWYIFKLKRKQLETENRTLESPGVRPEITETLRGQRQQLLNSVLFKISLYEAKIVNKLANTMLNNPSNLGLRPASSSATATPASSSTATPQTAAPASTASPAAAAASPKASASKQP